jgi:hypothetical protein
MICDFFASRWKVVENSHFMYESMLADGSYISISRQANIQMPEDPVEN